MEGPMTDFENVYVDFDDLPDGKVRLDPGREGFIAETPWVKLLPDGVHGILNNNPVNHQWQPYDVIRMEDQKVVHRKFWYTNVLNLPPEVGAAMSVEDRKTFVRLLFGDTRAPVADRNEDVGFFMPHIVIVRAADESGMKNLMYLAQSALESQGISNYHWSWPVEEALNEIRPDLDGRSIN